MSAMAKRSGVVVLGSKPRPIELTALEFDPENPRTIERLGPGASQGKIEEFLLGSEMKARDLVPSFISNGYIPYEPLIVKSTDKKGKFVVVEGNRRLAALRSMANSTDAEEKAAFELKTLKEISGLIKTEKGYHIIQLNAEERGFDRFRFAIRWKMIQDLKNQKMTQLIQSLNDGAQIQVFSDPPSFNHLKRSASTSAY